MLAPHPPTSTNHGRVTWSAPQLAGLFCRIGMDRRRTSSFRSSFIFEFIPHWNIRRRMLISWSSLYGRRVAVAAPSRHRNLGPNIILYKQIPSWAYCNWISHYVIGSHDKTVCLIDIPNGRHLNSGECIMYFHIAWNELYTRYRCHIEFAGRLQSLSIVFSQRFVPEEVEEEEEEEEEEAMLWENM